MQRLTGADKVVSFGPIVRTNATGAHGHNQPAHGAHVDYGARTVADFTRDLLPADEAERRLAGPAHAAQRVAADRDGRKRAVRGVRREHGPARGPVRQRSRRRARRLQPPLAVGLQPRLPARATAGTGCRTCSRGKCWCSSCSTAIPTRSSSPRTARSRIPNTPPDAAPRQSIEVRTIAYLAA